VKLEFNRQQLMALMKDFHTLSGIRMVLFDDEYRELMSYPESPCAFCRKMKSDAATSRLCAESDEHSFRRCDSERKLIIYTCHAGLIEAAIPLIDNHVIVGYLMFGQIAGDSTRDSLRDLLSEKLTKYGLETGFDPADGIPIKTNEEIQAAAKIMEACTLYALLNQTIALKSLNFTQELRYYLTQHISEALDSQSVASALKISRSKLYQQCQQYLGMGIAEYLRKLRIEKAQSLLRATSLPISEISGRVGFTDYNYFRRVFHKETGISAKTYRNSMIRNKSDDTEV